jgi:hypothetical protein
MQGEQKLMSAAQLRMRRNDAGFAKSPSERHRWAFYETVKIL